MKGATKLGVTHPTIVRYISIHAPMKGATFGCAQLDGAFLYFNPRAHEGRDLQKAKD